MASDEQEASQRFERFYTAKDHADCQQCYTELASFYENDFNALLGPAHDEIADIIMKKLTNNKDCFLLDAAAGTGMCAEAMIKFGYKGQIDALEMNTAMMRKAEMKSIYRKLIQFQISPDTKFPMEDETYDDLLCIGAFLPQHLPPEALKPMLRVVKPGGIVAFTTHLTPEHQSYEPPLEKFLATLSTSGQAKVIIRTELKQEKNITDDNIKLYVLRKSR